MSIGHEGLMGLVAALRAGHAGEPARMEASGHRAPAHSVAAMAEQSASLRRVLMSCMHSFLSQVIRVAQVTPAARWKRGWFDGC
jgi:hypothetical protein